MNLVAALCLRVRSHSAADEHRFLCGWPVESMASAIQQLTESGIIKIICKNLARELVVFQDALPYSKALPANVLDRNVALVSLGTWAIIILTAYGGSQYRVNVVQQVRASNGDIILSKVMLGEKDAHCHANFHFSSHSTTPHTAQCPFIRLQV